jgi:hypothetical protein
MRTESGGYRRDHLRALAQRVEVGAKEVRITGSKSELLRHARRRFKRKNGGFWRSQLCTEVARPKGFEPPTPRFVVWCSIQLSYGRILRGAQEDAPGANAGRERATSYRLQFPLARFVAGRRNCRRENR